MSRYFEHDREPALKKPLAVGQYWAGEYEIRNEGKVFTGFTFVLVRQDFYRSLKTRKYEPCWLGVKVRVPPDDPVKLDDELEMGPYVHAYWFNEWGMALCPNADVFYLTKLKKDYVEKRRGKSV